jgi:formylglycine-generating enzyme required for sulfatase activity
MNAEPWKGNTDVKEGADHAASCVSWDEAVAFCLKLTVQEHSAGRLPANDEYRLPREAEWEYACRAGTTTKYSFGDDASKLGDHAWFDANAKNAGEAYAHAVGLKKPNAWSLLDMHGNVWEWCGDGHGPTFPGGADPIGASSGSDRVGRGGCWRTTAREGSANRGKFAPGLQRNNLGFRVVRTIAFDPTRSPSP